jgi:hypothetical protein
MVIYAQEVNTMPDMTTRFETLLGVLLLSTLLTACSGESSRDTEAGTGRTASSTPTLSPAPKEGEIGSTQCSLSAKRLSFVVRDWGRVYGSIGREDHHRYTDAFATDLETVADAARSCKGAGKFIDFMAQADRIDAQSRRAAPDYALYDAAVGTGNEWLAGVGFGTNALSVG